MVASPPLPTLRELRAVRGEVCRLSRAEAERPRTAAVHALGPVEIHFEFRTAAARIDDGFEAKVCLVCTHAMRLNSLSLPKKFSIRWRHLVDVGVDRQGRGAPRVLRDDDLGTALIEIGDDAVAVEGLSAISPLKESPSIRGGTPTVSKR